MIEIETDGTLKIDGSVVIEPDPEEHPFRTAEGPTHFRRQVDEFAKAVRNLPNRCVTAQEGIQSMIVLDAIRDSARSGTPVHLQGVSGASHRRI